MPTLQDYEKECDEIDESMRKKISNNQQVNIWLDKILLLQAKMKASDNYMKFSAYITKLIEEDLNKPHKTKEIL